MKNLIPELPTDLMSQADYNQGSIVSKIMYQNEKMQITFFAMAKGEEFSKHAVTRKALIHILEGEGDFQISEEWHAIKAGDYFLLSENLVHAMTANSDIKFLLYLFP